MAFTSATLPENAPLSATESVLKGKPGPPTAFGRKPRLRPTVRFKSTAVASSASPEWNLIPGRILMVHTLLSGEVTLSARYGTNLPPVVCCSSGSYTMLKVCNEPLPPLFVGQYSAIGSPITMVTSPPRTGPSALDGATWLSDATSAIAITAATLRRPPWNRCFITCSPLEVD